jgi:GrpB-like predicted nucleotidyltransferase (UPF0157 family)
MTSRTGKPIVIAGYDAAWPERFERERAEILRACGVDAFVRIEHVGSTAVPGLAAKPIIDLMPGLRSLDDAAALIAPLAGIGYEYVPEFEGPSAIDEGMPFRRYFRKDVEGARAFHMHMVETGSEFWRDHLLFRDFLRISPEDVREYERVKRRVAAEYNANLTPESNINLGYTDRKSDCINAIMAKARARIVASTPIVIVDYDPEWPRRFEREREEILRAVGDAAVAVEHVGSTSVPGLAAKPKVDIAIGVRSIADGRAAIAAIEGIGYTKQPDEEDLDDWIVFAKREGDAGAFNLHMVPFEGERWCRYLLFRDHLRLHGEAADEYARLKRALAAEFGTNRLGYPQAKSDFVRAIERAAGGDARNP